MQITRKNVAKLASISALGAGALGVTAGTAEATGITYIPLNAHVGLTAGFGSRFETTIVPGISLLVNRTTFGDKGSFPNYWGRVALKGIVNSALLVSASVKFKPNNAAPGLKWSNLGSPSGGFIRVGQRNGSGTTDPGTLIGLNGSFYKLFEFKTSGSGAYKYGWIYFQQSLAYSHGPDDIILGIAWDTTGAQIAAGDTGGSQGSGGGGGTTPEPSTAVLASIAALALGAKGLRRARAERKKTA